MPDSSLCIKDQFRQEYSASRFQKPSTKNFQVYRPGSGTRVSPQPAAYAYFQNPNSINYDNLFLPDRNFSNLLAIP